MRYRNLTFVEAVEELANRAGIPLEHEQNKDKKKQISLSINYKINRESAIFFFKNLENNPVAVKYFENRGIHRKAQKYFGLGFAPDKWDGLLTYLTKKGFKEKDILDNGLVIKNEKRGNVYDRFRNRLIFPIFDLKKRVIGFGGRVVDDSLPKYINSPDTILFNKGRSLYNLNNAKDYSREGIILTEGYMDVIKLSINGYKNVVASLGTALTENQVKLMKKYSQTFYISYDSDEAGLKAAIKAANLLKSNNFECKILKFPENMDPDDFISKYGGAKYKEQMTNSFDYFGFVDHYLKKKYDIHTDSGKISYIKEANEHLASVKSPVERELYIEKISNLLGVSKEALQQELKSVVKGKGFRPQVIKKMSVSTSNEYDFETKLLEILTKNAVVKNHVMTKYRTFLTEDTSYSDKFKMLDEKTQHNESELLFEGIYLTQEELERVAEDYIHRIKLENLTRQKKELLNDMPKIDNKGQWQKKILELDKEIIRLRGLHNDKSE